MSIASRPGRRVRDRASPATSENEFSSFPTLALQGDFPSQVTVIPRALCTLLMSTGYLEEERRHVLVPYIEMRFAGIRQGALDPGKEEDQDLEELFSRVLPLENALWLISDMTRDIRLACQRLRNVSAGPKVFERERLRQAHDSAQKLAQQAELMATLLADLSADPEEAKVTAREPSTVSVSSRRRRETTLSGREGRRSRSEDVT